MDDNMETSMRIYTVAYGGRTPEEFLNLLGARGIRAVIDV